MKSVTVIGASLAGLYAARALRAQGYDGRLTIVGEEAHPPYDRPPLSKDFLTAPSGEGSSAAEDAEDRLALTDAEELTALDADWLLGTRATGLDLRHRAVRLDTGRTLTTDGLVLATGAAPLRLPGPAPAGSYTLRTLDDARALRAELTRGPVRVVVIGGGFLGAEAASSCAALGHRVTVVEAAPVPLARQLGAEIAQLCATLHADHGVTLLTGTRVRALRTAGDRATADDEATAADRVTAVELTDGRLLPADVVLTAIGVRPHTDWLDGSGLPLGDGIRCDAGCATPVPEIVAAGDVAEVAGVRAEHWTSATEQAATAVHNLLAGRTVRTHRALPYFWSDQYGVRIQFAGHRAPGDTPRIIEGSPDDRSFLARYERAGRPTAVLAVNRPRPFQRHRRELARAGVPASAG
ncbi:pyridine nucleotide-disulfide oxidoreductase [Streptomyces sp. NRRL F-4489]|uniref:NAD(P)/FAD-dependent oxidoreductase n=1 Tax=Streptomyces sp. NRRL F-4489 TaxID=1609095 RepID=UPI00074A4EC7|nr:FAD-dependent oxidoreductase [Streptomyces sp. NRRL F-4489]KUL51414.1 pyridine nucleotide-disulfide oxidoreductase [Streptomyces sp. NRRL F-4489]